jgi:hypothetical protein
MTERAHSGLTVEDLPFGVEPPAGMPVSAVAKAVFEAVPARLDAMAPGPVMGAFLASVDVSKLSGFDQIVVLRAHQKMASFYQAATYQDMAAVNTTMSTFDGYAQPDVEAAEMAAAEIRVALNLTRHAADVEMGFALEMHRRLPRLFDMLASGVIDVRRAKVIERGTMHLSDATSWAVVDDIADDAPSLTTGELRARLKKLCIETDPDEAKDRYDTAVANRRVVIEPTDDGTANIHAYDLPADEAAAIGNRIHAMARTLHGVEDESRSMDQLRTDVLLDYLNGITRHTAPKGGNVDVTVTMETLTGLVDRPAELAGFGPVIADVARTIANDTDNNLRVLICDTTTGEPTHVVTPTRRPTASQKRGIRARNQTCVFPGCRMPARGCDIDHTKAVADGGETCDCNLAPLCRHDHCIKHEHGWTYRRLKDGRWQWATRLGHTYQKTPEAGFQKPEARFQTPDPRSQISEAGNQISDPRNQISDPRNLRPDT